MSRAMNLKLSIEEVTQKCDAAGVSISAIEQLPSGDTHLVCTTGDGAAVIRRKCSEDVVEGKQKRFPFSIPQSRWAGEHTFVAATADRASRPTDSSARTSAAKGRAQKSPLFTKYS